MHCNIENQNKPTSWRRVDGRPLPRGSHLYGGILVIDVTTHDAAGTYECTVREQGSEIPVVRTEIVVIGRCFRFDKIVKRFCSFEFQIRRTSTNHFLTINANDCTIWRYCFDILQCYW